MIENFGPETKQILVTAALGAAAGSLWRAVVRPESFGWAWVAKLFLSLSVGILIGGTVIQHFELDGFKAAGVSAVAALLSEEVLRFFLARGRKLEQGRIDTSLKGGDDE